MTRKTTQAAWIFLAAASCFLFARGVQLAMQEYTLLHGTAGSPFVGLQNLCKILQSPNFPYLLRNSLLLRALELAGGLLLGGGMALLLSLLSNRRTALWLSCLMAVPAVLSPVLYAAAALSLFPAQWRPYPTYYPLLFVLQRLLPNAGIFVLFGGLYSHAAGEQRTVGALKGCLAALLFYSAQCLTPDTGSLLLTANPSVYSIADTLATYQHRTGMMQMDFSLAAASGVLLALLQLPVALLLGLCRPSVEDKLPTEHPASLRPFASILLLSGAAAAAALLLPANKGVFLSSLTPVLLSLPFALLLSVLLAGRSGGMVSRLAASAVLALGGQLIPLYLCMRAGGMVNTVWPCALIPLLSPCALMLLLAASGCTAARRPLPLILGLSLLLAALVWGDYNAPLLYLNDRALFPLSLAAREVLLATGSAGIPGIWLLAGGLLLGGAGACLIAHAFDTAE